MRNDFAVMLAIVVVSAILGAAAMHGYLLGNSEPEPVKVQIVPCELVPVPITPNEPMLV